MIAIIGGSGLEKASFFQETQTIHPTTPFGKTSAPIRIGNLHKKTIALVSRHGFEHEYSPSQIPYQANIWALQELGAKAILAASACGSLREEIQPGDLIVPNQIIDFTKNRNHSFLHDKRLEAHTPFGEPFSKPLNQLLTDSSRELDYRIHEHKTIITIEGPRFSSRAESLLYRQWGADIINMTTATEAVLANELHIPYAVLAMATDYDSWKTDRTPVTYQEVLAIMNQNSHRALEIFEKTIAKINIKP